MSVLDRNAVPARHRPRSDGRPRLHPRRLSAAATRDGRTTREPGALSGRTALVTGANRGIGKAIAAGLARLGATVLLTVRDRESGEQACEEIVAADPDADVRVEVCDVSDLAAVRAFAADLSSRVSTLDVLIHNAGVLPATRTETGDGHEVTLATHVLGPVLLTELLLPILATSSDPRVILMSSGGMYTQPLPVNDPEYRNGRYRGAIAYARTKRIQVALTPILARRWAPSTSASTACTPAGPTPRGGHVTSGLSDAHRPDTAHAGRGRRHRRLARRDPTRTADRPLLARSAAPTGALSAVDPVRRPRPGARVAVLRGRDRYRKPLRANGSAARARRWAAVAAVGVRRAWPPGTPVRSPRPPSANRSLR